MPFTFQDTIFMGTPYSEGNLTFVLSVDDIIGGVFLRLNIELEVSDQPPTPR